MDEDGSFKDRPIKYISFVLYCSALDEEHIIGP